MGVGIRVLLTAMSALTVAICVGTLWAASALMAIEALTDAREDQLASASQQTALQVLTYFQQASLTATQVSAMFNASVQKSPGAPELQMMNDYFNSLQVLLRSKPSIDNVLVLRPRNRTVVAAMAAEDQVCDLDGLAFASAVGAIMTIDTVGNPPGCVVGGLSICAVGGYSLLLNGATIGQTSNPGLPMVHYQTVPCSVTGNSPGLWNEGLPGDILDWDTGIRKPTWGKTVTVGNIGNQVLYRRMYVNVVGSDWAPNAGIGVVSIRMSQSSTLDLLEADTLIDILERAANSSSYNDFLFLLSAEQELIATSDPAFDVEKISDDGSLGLYHALDPAVSEDVTSLSAVIFEKYCPTAPCDWTDLRVLLNIGNSVVMLQYLEDEYAAELNMLLVSSVKKSEILEPARELNVNIAIISCCVFVFLCAASFAMARTLATPISKFAQQLIVASLMVDQDLKSTKSVVSEIDVMQTALGVLVARLLEYKSFLPAGMFDEVKDGDDESDTAMESTPSHTKEGVSRRSTASSHNMAASKRQKGVNTKCALKSKTVIMFCINIRGWTRFVFGSKVDEATILDEQSTYISTVVAGLSNKGKIDRFNGDRVLASFGTIDTCAGSTACKLAVDLLSTLQRCPIDFLKGGCTGGMAKGKILVGNSGDRMTRAFNLMGPAVNIAWKLADVATSFCQEGCQELVLDSVLHQDVQIETESFAVGVLDTSDKFFWMEDLKKVREMHLVVKLKAAAGNEEWMYQVESMREVHNDVTIASIMDQIIASDFDRTVFEGLSATLHDLLIAAGKPGVAEKLGQTHESMYAYAFCRL